MSGKQMSSRDVGYQGHYVTPSICVVKDTSLASVKKSIYQQSEIFGPNMAIYSFKTEAEALELANATQYGLRPQSSHKTRNGSVVWPKNLNSDLLI